MSNFYFSESTARSLARDARAVANEAGDEYVKRLAGVTADTADAVAELARGLGDAVRELEKRVQRLEVHR